MKMNLTRLVVALLCLLPFKSSAQTYIEQDRWIITPEISQVNFGDLGRTVVGGVRVQYFVTDNLSIDYTFSAGKNYAHLPASFGLMGIALDRGFPVTASEFEALLYLLIVPEGLSYHFQPSDPILISPFINILGITYFYEVDSGGPRNYTDNLTAVTGVGIRSNFVYRDLFLLAPSVEAAFAYGPRKLVFKTSLGFGFIF